MRSWTLAAVAVLLPAVPAVSAEHDKKDSASVHRSDVLKWQDGPPSLPPGAKMAVLEGDPAKPGSFVFRVKVPDGYKIPLHTHPKPERVTVLTVADILAETIHNVFADDSVSAIFQDMNALF